MLLKDLLEKIEKTIEENKIILPWGAMATTAVIVAVGQYSLLFSVSAISIAGAATLAGVKASDLFLLAKKLLTDAQTTTLPGLDKTLQDLNQLLPNINAVVSELEHPMENIGGKIEHVETVVEGKATQLINGFRHLIKRDQNSDPANEANKISISETPKENVINK